MTTTPPNEKQDQLARLDTSKFYQPFLERVNATYNGAAARGWFYIGTNGLRTYEEQDELYSHGRTKLADANGKKLGIVTNARGGQSLHNMALAIDSYPTVVTPPRLVLVTPDVKENYRVLAEEAVKAGLEAGYYWDLVGSGLKSDDPHIQLNLKKFGITLARLRQAYSTGGYPAVFAFLDHFAW